MKYQSFISNSSINFFNQNLTTFLVIVFFTFIDGPVHPMIGNLIFLPLGAVSLCYLLFGYRVLIAVFLAIEFSDYWITGNPHGHLAVNLVGALAPLLAIASMKFFKLSNFFEGGKLVFQHLLFLAILTAFYNTLMKFFVWSYISLAEDSNITIDAMQFIKNYLIGDALGCLTVFFFAALVIVPGIRYFVPHLVPSEIQTKEK